MSSAPENRRTGSLVDQRESDGSAEKQKEESAVALHQRNKNPTINQQCIYCMPARRVA